MLLLTLETIDLNGVESFYALSNKLNLHDVLPNKITIWKLRNNNPMRKSYVNNNIKLEEFEALTKIVAEMSKFLYPYIREILESRDDLNKNYVTWNNFKSRFVELVYARLKTTTMRVKKLVDPDSNDEILINFLLTLALSISDEGFVKLKSSLLNF